ncbi:Peptide deformylase [Paenibacillus konkukensis]|uniref:Peptide deformylase n=1 Tax=Paenibacillus konkukensis TaxID=2020716 RepID=A0ABY4RL01_9BACL|nr:peptide deformylase [Paenibacillus konkukensis]UQZ83154.1 Peptide deformylase [Paenibacillus konkukensis]
MAVKTIVPFGESILRKKAKPVTEFNAKLEKLLDDMTDTLYDAGGSGLAAPQIGILKRVVVMDCGEGLIELINPEIIDMGGEQTGPEACLSYPNYSGIVKRAQRVSIRAKDRRGNPFELEGKGYLARCIQHEIDHLNGVLFVDHVRDHVLYHDYTKERVPLIDVLRLTNEGL